MKKKMFFLFALCFCLMMGCGVQETPETPEPTVTSTPLPTSTPTPTPTPTSTPTPTPTSTPTPTPTSTPTPTPLPTSTPTPTPIPIEVPYVFPDGDYITTEDVTIDTGTVILKIGEGIYVPGVLEEVITTTVETIEKVSGLRFDGNGYCKERDMGEHVYVDVNRAELFTNVNGYTGLETGESGYGYVLWSDANVAHVAPGDLMLGYSYVIAHELTHVLMYRQREWFHSEMLNEGFAEYTTYSMLLELEKTAPEVVWYLGKSIDNLMNMSIEESAYEILYQQPVEYWIENGFTAPINRNGTYALGMRFMAYLDDVYGNYSDWILNFGDEYPYAESTAELKTSELEQQLDILKQTYGEDVFDNFYPWLKAHQEEFVYYTQPKVDRTNLKAVNIYPYYTGFMESVFTETMKYKDLYINLETARKYIEEYKGMDASHLTLYVSNPNYAWTENIPVNLYRADGSYTQIITGDEPVSLEGISYIKLVGEGELTRLEIGGFSSIGQ